MYIDLFSNSNFEHRPKYLEVFSNSNIQRMPIFLELLSNSNDAISGNAPKVPVSPDPS